MLKVISTKCK